MAKARLPLVLVVLTTALGGCAEKGMDTVEVVGPCALPDECKFTSGGCSDFLLSRPIIDVGLGTSLQVYLDVRNQLKANDDSSSGTTNTHEAQITEAEISYDAVTPSFSLAGASAPTFANVPPGKDSVVKVYVLPEEAVVRLNALGVPAFNPTTPNYWDMVAKIRLKGTYQDTSSFESGDYKLPVRVCNGCLAPCATQVTCPPNADGQSPALCPDK